MRYLTLFKNAPEVKNMINIDSHLTPLRKEISAYADKCDKDIALV